MRFSAATETYTTVSPRPGCPPRAAGGRPYLERAHHLLGGAEVVEPAHTPRVVPDDPEDDKLVAAARAARAVLVTNDAHLLALAGSEGLQVLRPADVTAHGDHR